LEATSVLKKTAKKRSTLSHCKGFQVQWKRPRKAPSRRMMLKILKCSSDRSVINCKALPLPSKSSRPCSVTSSKQVEILSTQSSARENPSRTLGATTIHYPSSRGRHSLHQETSRSVFCSRFWTDSTLIGLKDRFSNSGKTLRSKSDELAQDIETIQTE
jgi:hypothetical protein